MPTGIQVPKLFIKASDLDLEKINSLPLSIRSVHTKFEQPSLYSSWYILPTRIQVPLFLRAATDQSQKTRNKKQNGLAHSRFIVCVTPKQKKNIAWFENQVLAEHVRKSQSTIYLKSHGCVHGFQNEVSLINFSTMFCKPCSLSRNRSLRDAKSARHMFV